MLGGSSGVNFMVFGRGSSDEYNAWASLGNPGWDWNGLMSYFKKSETVSPGDANVLPGASTAPGLNTNFAGNNGPLKIGFNTKETLLLPDLAAKFATSFTSVGAFVNPDPVRNGLSCVWIHSDYVLLRLGLGQRNRHLPVTPLGRS